MNKDNKELARHIDVMLAFQNGEDMQYCKLEPHGYKWTNLRKNGTLSFNWQVYDYRVKSKPREFTITIDADGEIAGQVKALRSPGEVIKVREVL